MKPPGINISIEGPDFSITESLQYLNIALKEKGINEILVSLSISTVIYKLKSDAIDQKDLIEICEELTKPYIDLYVTISYPVYEARKLQSEKFIYINGKQVFHHLVDVTLYSAFKEKENNFRSIPL